MGEGIKSNNLFYFHTRRFSYTAYFKYVQVLCNVPNLRNTFQHYCPRSQMPIMITAQTESAHSSYEP